ncbi:MAG TPA: peptidoglycan-binding domain-containing protein [Bryobacteraceae bacterium]|nr:peptidoglycan-binding domain-containing protein [Bryobacteraceae bacterium]
MLRNLYEGLCGPDVRALQEALNLHIRVLGLKPLRLDGIFGPKTRCALQAFQKLKHLVPDGIFGPKTRLALYPVGVYHSRLCVTSGPTSAPKSRQIAPASHPVLPVTIGAVPGAGTLVPMPAPPPPSNPKTAPPPKIGSYKIGDQFSIPIKQLPEPKKPTPDTHTLTLDWIGLIHAGRFHSRYLDGPYSLGADLGVGLPISDGAKYTATGSLALTLAPDMFRFGRWDLLTLSAKAGLGVVHQDTDPKWYLTGNASVTAGLSYDIISGDSGRPALLKFGLTGGFSAALDHRDSQFHLSTSLPVFLGVSGTY